MIPKHIPEIEWPEDIPGLIGGRADGPRGNMGWPEGLNPPSPGWVGPDITILFGTWMFPCTPGCDIEMGSGV